MGDPSPWPDPGLQPERTALAWRRTALGLASGAAVSARALFPTLGLVAVAVASAGGALAIGLWVWGSRRYRHAYRRPDGEAPAKGPGGAALGAFAVLATAVGVAALLYVCRQ
jgi:putative membrane protein